MRTNLDVTVEALLEAANDPAMYGAPAGGARAALDAIHPALADLTPDDVAAIFDCIRTYEELRSFRPRLLTAHAREVLSRD